MKIRLLLIYLVIAMSQCPVAWAQTDGMQDTIEGEIYRAKVIHATRMESVPALEEQTGGFVKESQTVTVKLTEGPHKGQELVIENTSTGCIAYDLIFKTGDDVLVQVPDNQDEISDAYITDFVRDRHLIYLAILFVFLLVLLGGIKGVKSVLSLGITIIAVVAILLPMLMKGYNPITVTVLVASLVTTITFVIVGGWTKKTLAAILGTTGGVIVAGILALLVGNMTHLTGFGEEEAAMLMYIPQGVDFDIKGLLFAGIIIGTLGAVMDVGMSIASAMDEIKKVNPIISPLCLVRSGMNVGRDIMGTMANTLILAYTGAAIPLMLLLMAYETPLIKVVNLDTIATEVVRALAGSIGLIVAIPLTALAAGFTLSTRSRLHSDWREH